MRQSIACAVLGALLLLGGTALAGPQDPCQPGATPRARLVRGPDGQPRMVFTGPLIICGRRHAPQAFYVLPRSATSYQPAPLHRSSLPDIAAAVRRAPF